MKLYKKVLSIICALVMSISALVVGNVYAFAAGWASSAQNVDYETWYNEYLDVEYDDYNYHACLINVPARGKVSIRTQREDDYGPSFDIFKSNNMDNEFATSSGGGYGKRIKCDFGTSSAGGYNWEVQEFDMPAGNYYIAFKTFSEPFSFDYKISYTPYFSNTSISRIFAKSKSIKVNWSKCSNVSGYQLQYSTNKNMKSAKTINLSSSSSSKTIKNLKSKKNYYVRIRTYKTININGSNKTYYGKWSPKKSVKIK